MEGWREIGRICRLQIQRSSLKVGPPKGRYYDPTPLREVGALVLTGDGVFAEDGGARVLDIHNAAHPETKNARGVNDISLGFTGHYAAIRARYGEHVSDGIAGENILVESAGMVTLDDIAGGVLIFGEDGRRVELEEVRVAHPCVEFSRFIMGDPFAPPAMVTATLQFLDAGVRGFYACVPVGVEARIIVGDRVWGRPKD